MHDCTYARKGPMRFFAGLCFAVACLLAAADISADQGVYPSTDEELRAAYDALQWHNKAGPYKLPASHATIQMQEGLLLLLGTDAQRYSWLGSGAEYPATEAVLIHNLGSVNREVYYEWYDDGHVGDSDWEEVDSEALLIHYREAIEDANGAREKGGRAPMYVVDWLEPPHYAKSTSIVTYAIEMRDKNGNWANAVALRLGRSGYTTFTWVGPIDDLKSSSGRPDLLNLALAGHAFDEGHRYEDFKKGDRAATYGVAGAVAASLGVTFATESLAATLAKIAIPALAVFALAISRVRELFGSFRRRS